MSEDERALAEFIKLGPYGDITDNEARERQARRQGMRKLLDVMEMLSGCDDYCCTFQGLLNSIADRYFEEKGADQDGEIHISNEDYIRIAMDLSREEIE